MTVMTLSFKSLSFRLGILPIMVSASLSLSACQDSFSSHEQEAKKGTNTINNKSNTASNINPIIDEVSAEQKMIANLANYRWTLMSATDNNAQSLSKLMEIKDKVRLSFGQYQGRNTLNYSVGCNTVSAAYQLQGPVLTIKDSMSTKMSCGDLNMAENNLITLMQGDSQLVLALDDDSKDDQPILTQVTSDSATLVWKGRLTAQAKYNTKGETVFWAVNAQMIPCEDSSSQLCLQVKPITYDDQGIKNSEGKWTPFAGDIDGYQHDGKHDEVLRLQRYQLDTSEKADDKAPSTSGESYAYVLDAVIESSVVEEESN